MTILLLTLLLPAVLLANPLEKRAAICGTKGYDDGTDSYSYTTGQTYNTCLAACQQDSANCLSFAFGNGECDLYNVPVSGNFEADPSSPYSFYDISCSGSSTTASTTTTKSSSTSTTKVASTTTTTTKTTTKSTTTTTKSTTTTTKSTGSSTTKASSTSTSSQSSSSTTSSTTTPPCPLPTWVIHDFVFFNSSHNLDCAASNGENPLCETGLPPQPAGYGPPDYVDATVDGIGSCHQQNPGSVPLREVGSDVVRCAGSEKQLSFFGSSNTASSNANFQVQNEFTCPDGNTYTAYGQALVPMQCVYDSGNNATCTISPSSVTVPATSFD